MTNPVLVGIDGSAESLSAADWAGEEAARRNLPIRLLNVWANPVSNVQFSPNPEGMRFWAEGQVREAGRRMTERHPHMAVEAQQIYGVPGQVLLHAADASELTVLGHHGRGAVADSVLGGTALHVLARSGRPVVLVRADQPADETGKVVVLGLDLGRPCESLLTFAFEQAADRGAVVHAVHVWNEHEVHLAAPTPGAGLAAQVLAEQERGLAQALAPWRQKFPSVEVRHSVLQGPVAQRLAEAGKDADLLVIGRRRLHAPSVVHIGPVARAVLHHAARPVAVVSHE
ncbi:universal stress protein [Streptomyces sp. NBC_00669]|uniref:universal stress protein n=1 Tax=Streptomyces sp. NBC_00669 TaxID=2976011 RepID=UPI002E324510|nr:universal stress protein [Streptomyces sp. NBC_00669]